MQMQQSMKLTVELQATRMAVSDISRLRAVADIRRVYIVSDVIGEAKNLRFNIILS